MILQIYILVIQNLIYLLPNPNFLCREICSKELFHLHIAIAFTALFFSS